MSGFSSKISHKRFHASREMTNNASFPCELSGNDRESMCNAITFQCESDRGRIINSAAVRRLQQKTQVFPLERNAAVRSRLTHSLEVMQVGRFITRKLISKMQRLDSHKSDIEGLEDALESIVEMSCLMHDVGNPPFGHFGERAIQDWLSSNLGDCIRAAFEDKTNAHESTYVPEDLIKDIIGFEGNAQGIRIITNLQKLNLTKTQIASVLKYTRCGTEERPSDEQHPQYYLLKKVGYYFSEKSIVEEVVSFHGLANRHRHPIAYIMEAADDISYCIADLEDAVDKNPDASGFIFDGFPRTTAQAEALDKFLAGKNMRIDATIALEADDEILIQRLLERGKVSGRTDDQDENKIRNRFEEYNLKTAPLKDFYETQGKFHSVNGIGAIDEITMRLGKVIEEL
mgnify:CR=1 FL=1